MKKISEMTDVEVLAAAGDHGPAVIGKELFERAQAVRQRNPNGDLGPAILDSDKPARIVPPRPTRPKAEGEKAAEGTTTTSAPTPTGNSAVPPVVTGDAKVSTAKPPAKKKAAAKKASKASK